MASCLATFQSWRWSWHDPRNRRAFSKLHGVTTQKTALFKFRQGSGLSCFIKQGARSGVAENCSTSLPGYWSTSRNLHNNTFPSAEESLFCRYFEMYRFPQTEIHAWGRPKLRDRTWAVGPHQDVKREAGLLMGKPNEVWDIHLGDSDIPGVDRRRLASGTPHPFPDRDQMLILAFLEILEIKAEYATTAHKASCFPVSLLHRRLPSVLKRKWCMFHTLKCLSPPFSS
jgi:hypothetical protein